MTEFRNNWGGYALGETPSTATSGGDSGDAFSTFARSGTHTATVVESPFYADGRALRIASPAGATGNAYADYNGAGSRRVAGYKFITIGSTPIGASTRIMELRNALDSIQASVTRNVDNTLTFFSLTGPGSNVTPVLAAGTYLVEIEAVLAASPTTTNARLIARVTNWATKAVVFEYDNSAGSFGVSGSLLRTFRVGRPSGTTLYETTVGPVGFNDNSNGFMTPPSDFPPPTGLTANGISASTIRVTWNARTGATSYTLWASATENGTYTAIYTGTALTFDHTGLPPLTTRFYQIEATK